MAKITDFLNKIKKAKYGLEVRGAIADVVEAINKECENTTGRQDALQDTFDGLIINAGNSNAEIVTARTDNVNSKAYDTLGERLDAMESSKKKTDVMLNVADFRSIQEALTEAKRNKTTTVYVPAGEYLLSDTLRIYANTELQCSNRAIIKKNSSSFNCMLVNGDNEAEYDAYNGQSNITVKGGIWDANFNLNSQSNIMSFGKAQNILIEDVTFKDVINNHHVELAGVKNATIKNCKFTGYKDITSDASRGYSEAIQIGTLYKENFPFFGSYDNTPCVNILVDGCYFENVGVGIGGHGAVQGVYDSEIKVVNCTFKDCSYAGVRNYKFKNCLVSGNTFDNCRIGVLGSFSPKGGARTKVEALEDFIVTNNIFLQTENTRITRSHAVFIMGGCTNSSDFDYAKRVNISSNTFSGIGEACVRLQLCTEPMIVNNIANGARNFLYADFIDYASIDNNTIKNMTENAIRVTKTSSIQMSSDVRNNFDRIRNNFIENAGGSAISCSYLIDSAIDNNIMQAVCQSTSNSVPAISILDSSKKLFIDNNFLRNYKVTCNYGINVTSNCEMIVTKMNDVTGKTGRINNAGTSNSFDGFFMWDNVRRERKKVSLESGSITVS